MIAHLHKFDVLLMVRAKRPCKTNVKRRLKGAHHENINTRFFQVAFCMHHLCCSTTALYYNTHMRAKELRRIVECLFISDFNFTLILLVITSWYFYANYIIFSIRNIRITYLHMKMYTVFLLEYVILIYLINLNKSEKFSKNVVPSHSQ